jgi:amino acid permease
MLAVIWHYWVGVVLAIASVLTLVGLVAQYFFKVERTRYPKGLED